MLHHKQPRQKQQKKIHNKIHARHTSKTAHSSLNIKKTSHRNIFTSISSPKVAVPQHIQKLKQPSASFQQPNASTKHNFHTKSSLNTINSLSKYNTSIPTNLCHKTPTQHLPLISQSSKQSLFPQHASYSLTSTAQDYDPTGRPIHRATTILCVRKNDSVVVIGDGQVSLGPTIVKPNARKVRRIGQNGNVIIGFAGSTADAFALVEILEQSLEQHNGNLLRAAVEAAKGWRTGKHTRHLEAMLIATDEHVSLCISGNGDVIESHDGLLGIGSGSMYALSAARALIDLPDHDSLTIAKKSMQIAADICVYTNHNFIIDSLKIVPPSLEEQGHSTPLSIGKEDVIDLITSKKTIEDDKNVKQ